MTVLKFPKNKDEYRALRFYYLAENYDKQKAAAYLLTSSTEKERAKIIQLIQKIYKEKK